MTFWQPNYRHFLLHLSMSFIRQLNICFFLNYDYLKRKTMLMIKTSSSCVSVLFLIGCLLSKGLWLLLVAQIESSCMSPILIYQKNWFICFLQKHCMQGNCHCHLCSKHQSLKPIWQNMLCCCTCILNINQLSAQI